METFVATPLEELHSLHFAAVSKLPINQCLRANYDSYLVLLWDSDVSLLNRFQGCW